MALYEIDIGISITSASETFSDSLTTGELFVANDNVIPVNGTLIYITNPIKTDFIGRDLSAAKKDSVYASDKGAIVGDIFEIFSTPVSARYVTSVVDGSGYISIDKRNGKILTYRDRVPPSEDYKTGYKFVLGNSDYIFMDWSSNTGSVGLKSYICINDADNTLLETNSSWTSTRTGINDILIFNNIIHDGADNTVIIFTRPLPITTSAATITADLTNVVNKIIGNELIFKTQIAYSDSASAAYSYYTGDRTRNIIYAPDWTAPHVSGTYPQGISRFLINPNNGQFVLEDWNDANYEDFEGIQVTPPFDVVPYDVSYYYVDFGAISTGIGTFASPFNHQQFSAYNHNGAAISVGVSAKDGDTFYLKGLGDVLYGQDCLSKIGGYNYISWPETGEPYKLYATAPYGPWVIQIGIDPVYDPHSWSATQPTIKIENALIDGLYFGAVTSASPWSGTYTVNNSIIYNDFYTSQSKDWEMYFNGCTFVNSWVYLSEAYESLTMDDNNKVYFNDTIFDNTNITDTGANFGIAIFNYCLFTNSITEVSARASSTYNAGTLQFNNCTFNWTPTVPFVAYNDIVIDQSSDTLKSSTYGIPVTSAVRQSTWITNSYDIGFWNSTRTGPGAFYFHSATPIETSSTIEETKNHYITICGTGGTESKIKFGMNKFINLVNFLPQYLKKTETEEFLKFFEDFLNTMYEGLPGYIIDETELDVTRDTIPPVSAYNFKSYIFSANEISATQEYTSANNVGQVEFISSAGMDDILIPMLSANNEYLEQRISILEKVHRIAELQDPDLIDLEYIQFFAKNLGYDININRNEIGTNIGNISTLYQDNESVTCSGVDENKYIRFVVSNLPTWYKIKSTRNAIKVMLYSFGLIGDLVEYYTNDYKNNWKIDYDGDASVVNSNFYPTPHFAIVIDIDASYDSISFDWEKRRKVINAIEGLRPINTVFENLVGFADRKIQIGVAAQTRLRYFAVIR